MIAPYLKQPGKLKKQMSAPGTKTTQSEDTQCGLGGLCLRMEATNI